MFRMGIKFLQIFLFLIVLSDCWFNFWPFSNELCVPKCFCIHDSALTTRTKNTDVCRWVNYKNNIFFNVHQIMLLSWTHSLIAPEILFIYSQRLKRALFWCVQSACSEKRKYLSLLHLLFSPPLDSKKVNRKGSKVESTYSSLSHKKLITWWVISLIDMTKHLNDHSR